MNGSTTWCQNSLTIFMSPNATLGMINIYFYSLVFEVVFTCSIQKGYISCLLGPDDSLPIMIFG